MATLSKVRDFFAHRLSSEVGVPLPEVRLETIWHNNTGEVVKAGTTIRMPWEDEPTGIVTADIPPGASGKITYRGHKPSSAPPDHILLQDIIHPNGAREVHVVSLDKFAEMFHPALEHMSPIALDKLPDAAFQALLDHDSVGGKDGAGNPAPLGYRKFLEKWRARGLI